MEQSVKSVIEHRVAEVWIDVKDYPKIEPFYKDFLGLPLVWGNGKKIGYFDMQGTGILIVEMDDPKPQQLGFAIATKDIDAAHALMSKAGVTVGDIQTLGNGQRTFEFKDPEGNTLSLIQYKGKYF